MSKNKLIRFDCSRTPKREIPSILIWFFTSVQFAFGLNFGFNKILKKNVRFLANCFYTIIFIFFVAVIVIQILYDIEIKELGIATFIVYGLIQYSFQTICLGFSKYNLYDFIVDIYSVHTNIKWNKNNAKFIVTLFIIFFSTMCIIQTIICYLLCTITTLCPSFTLLLPYLNCILLISLDVIILVQMLIYFYVYHGVKYLKVSLEEKDIKWVRKQFTAIADICDKISPTYGRLVSTYYAVNILSFHMYRFLKYISLLCFVYRLEFSCPSFYSCPNTETL